MASTQKKSTRQALAKNGSKSTRKSGKAKKNKTKKLSVEPSKVISLKQLERTYTDMLDEIERIVKAEGKMLTSALKSEIATWQKLLKEEKKLASSITDGNNKTES
jgi:hypothetical protein